MRAVPAAILLLGAAVAPALAQVPTDTAAPLVQEIATIRLGQTRVGLLERGDHTMGDGTLADVWIVEVTAQGHRLVVDAVSRTFDIYIMLLDAAGVQLADDDDSGPGSNSHIEFQTRAPGRYQIVVNSSGDVVRTGQYTLTVR